MSLKRHFAFVLISGSLLAAPALYQIGTGEADRNLVVSDRAPASLGPLKRHHPASVGHCKQANATKVQCLKSGQCRPSGTQSFQVCSL